jgi:hypothetical protein
MHIDYYFTTNMISIDFLKLSRAISGRLSNKLSSPVLYITISDLLRSLISLLISKDD